MSSNSYDDIAKILKEAVKRYPEDAFDDTRRLKGLLADHLSGLNNEINIVIGAIEEGVPSQLKATGSTGIDVTVDRLTEKLENAKGIRGDIAKSAVLAFSYALGMSDLPSSKVETLSRTSQHQADMPSFGKSDIKPDSGDDWVGVSDVVQEEPVGKTGGATPPGKKSGTGMMNDLMEKVKKNPKILAVAVFAFLAIVYFNRGPAQQVGLGQPQPQQQATPQPQQRQTPQPRQQAAPQQQQRQTPQRQQQATPQRQQRQTTQNMYFSDDKRNVWRTSPQNASQGFAAFTTSINGKLLIMKTRRTGKKSFSLTISNQNGQQLFSGQGKLADATHFSYTFQGSGQKFQGKWHINHMPN